MVEVPYPIGRGKCDLVLSGVGFKPEFGLAAYEWAIENKYVRFIGDNGKNNDYGVTKVVSPYRKDRSSVLDAERLLKFHPAEKKAILMYGFEFNSDSHRLALEWCESHETEGDQTKNRERVKNMKSILDKADPKTHEMSMRDLIPLFEAAARTKGIRLGPCIEENSQDSTAPFITEGEYLPGRYLKVILDPLVPLRTVGCEGTSCASLTCLWHRRFSRRPPQTRS